MAKLVAENFSNGKSKVIVDIPKNFNFGYASDVKLWLSSSKVEQLGWHPTVDLIEMYKRMISWIIFMEK